MDEEARRFRSAARRENRGRLGTAKRYSDQLRREAVAYAHARAEGGVSLGQSARALGVSLNNLRRWISKRPKSAFRRVKLQREPRPQEPKAIRGSLVLTTRRGERVEGLDVESLTALLRALS